MTSKTKRISVLGAGSWGTTLAVVLDENKHNVTLWEHDSDRAQLIRQKRENETFLPGTRIADSVRVEHDFAAAIEGAEALLFVTPSHVIRDVAKRVAILGALDRNCIVISAAKGLEEGSLKRMSQVLLDELDVDERFVCTLSGPSHAEEVIRKMPTSVVVAGSDAGINTAVQEIFFRPYFRVYTNTDLTGVEIGVALKNIIAIAAGICDGLGYGDNTKAALLTRGLVEISRLGVSVGGRRETFFGLAGIGDLIATALSRHSRNRYVGERIGGGASLQEVLDDMVMVAEGVRTTHAAVDMAKKYEVELPIISSIHSVLFDGKEPREAINELMNRPPQEEMNWIESTGEKRG